MLDMTKILPWAVLAALVLYRRTWGACQCEDLQRRLNAAHREVRQYQYENLTLIQKGSNP